MTTTPDPIALLKEMVGIPSVSGSEEKLASFVFDWATSAGLAAERRGRNVVIFIGRRGGPQLLLNSHLDTVPPSPGWGADPFRATEGGGRITGLGANDAKGSVAAILCAVARLRDETLPGEVVAILTVNEEGDGEGGLRSLIGELGRLDAAVIGEPTGLEVCRAQKGLLVLRVLTSGVARHAAHAHRLPGKNAVVEAARAILAIEGWRPGAVSPLLGPATCEVTMIEGGERHNVVPDACSFTLDIRTVPGLETNAVVEEIRSRTGARVEILNDCWRPFETAEGEPIVRAALKASGRSAAVGSSTMSDAAWTGHLPTIKVGPGQTERSHTAGEYITVEELLEGTTFYERLIREYFGC